MKTGWEEGERQQEEREKWGEEQILCEKCHH